MSERDELDPFDDDIIADVASDTGVAAERLTELARTHQSNVRDLPDIDDIVYEWRNYFHRDPLLAQTPAVYYLALPSHVWDEFAEDVGAGESERTALVALHGRQAERDADDVGIDVDRFDAAEPVILTRP